ncbi:MAG: LacI family DNA-binding transcriptional regulator [Saprospiraceae bacterium]
MGQVRIKDIAERAGVSIGTVDRVLHNRGRVSESAAKRVKEAISTLNYNPNLMARSLANGKRYRIATIIPNSDNDDFWKAQRKGIQKATEYMLNYGFEIVNYEFNDQKPRVLLDLMNHFFSEQYDGLLIAPTLKDEGIKFLNACDLHNLPYVQINSYINRSGQYAIGYVGQDSFQSGLLAAKLLDISIDPNGGLLIIHMEKETTTGPHMLKKEQGFEQYFCSSNNGSRNIVKLWISDYRDQKILRLHLEDYLNRFKNISGIFVTTSRCHHIARALLSIGREDLVVIGFDLIEENIDVLKDYKRLFLINQNPVLQGYYGLMNFFDLFLKKNLIIEKRYLPLDIVTFENAQNYIHGES